MGQTSDEIETYIRSTREDLRANLDELEGRVKSAVDWRERFRSNPALGLGLALAGGFLLAGLTTRAPPRTATRHDAAASDAPRRRHLQHVWDNMQSTLIGVAASRATDLLSEFLLGALARPAADADAGGDDELQGEGDYRAARRYRASAERYAHSGDAARAARAAAPRDADEAADMAEAEAEGRARGRPS
ncbi:MAG TPA: hypothetical protein VET66_12735 [Steroidobacteraceae bacterium]|nr:hypothetical protein [Candidatus Dormibacteraeota bacterium]HYM29010.1 hypothetical protein [Steroidobacteraceae bacterium]